MKIKLIKPPYILLTAVIILCCGCSSGNLANIAYVQSERPIAEFEAQSDSAKTRAESIAAELKKIKEIEHAAVVITGNTAIVGIMAYGEPDDKELIELKRLVEKNVIAFDREIDHVAVSASAELFERVTQLGGGKSIAEENELHENNDGNDAFFRVVPSF